MATKAETELRVAALDFAIRAGAQGTATVGLANDFYAFLNGDGEAKPTTRKTSPEKSAADKAAEEPSTTVLEGKEETAASSSAKSDTAGEDTTGLNAPTDASPSDLPTRDEIMPLLIAYSREHGETALKPIFDEFGAEKFSAIPAERYGDLKARLADGPSKSLLD